VNQAAVAVGVQPGQNWLTQKQVYMGKQMPMKRFKAK
jgi:hypothetical protein